MDSAFVIRVDEWLDSAFGAEGERQTLAAIRIMVVDEAVTRLEDLRAKTVRDTARLSACQLAYWLAENWWRLRWEPEGPGADPDWLMSHHLGSAGTGYIWPPLVIASDGQSIRLSLRPTRQDGAVRPVRYINAVDINITADELEHGLDGFVDLVIARLVDLGVRDTDLELLWAEIRRERTDPDLYLRRRLEALLGIDPGEAAEDLLNQLIHYGASLGATAIDEIAAAARGQVVTDLESISAMRQAGGDPIEVPNRDALVRTMREQARHRIMPWQVGERLADAARDLSSRARRRY